MRMLQPGTQLEKYQILAHLGHGGMSEVYHARDGRAERDVVLKIPHDDLSGDVRAHQLLLREIEIGTQLTHEHIQKLYGVVYDAGVPCLVLEYLEAALRVPSRTLALYGRRRVGGDEPAHDGQCAATEQRRAWRCGGVEEGILKAMRRDPARRWLTVAEISAFLANPDLIDAQALAVERARDEATQGRPMTALEQELGFSLRHMGMIVVGVILRLALLIGLAQLFHP
jgi:hypothetical protein